MALQNFSFRVEPGQKVGILGRTGSGKSTLVSAILRLVDTTPPEGSRASNSSKLGQILLDGIPITTIPRTRLRSSILAIPLEALILSGSIRTNENPFHAIYNIASGPGTIDDKSYDELTHLGSQESGALGRD